MPTRQQAGSAAGGAGRLGWSRVFISLVAQWTPASALCAGFCGALETAGP